MADYIQHVLSFDVRQGRPVRLEKMAAFSTSRDPATSDTLVRAGTMAQRVPDFAQALARHSSAWDELWGLCDVRLSGDQRAQLLVRLHIGHILQVCSEHTADLDAGAPARGLNGEAYRGHVFWDELFVLPFLNFRMSKVSRGLLMYRYRRLDEARGPPERPASAVRCSRGRAAARVRRRPNAIHLNPLSGRWEPDLSSIQRHINAAIFYNIWQYFEVTEDVEFLWDYGAEMMLEIARFWATIAHFNRERERFEIHGVMGPDEFHEKYPGATEAGLRNNAYTNVMVVWLCAVAGNLLELLPRVEPMRSGKRIHLADDELRLWEDMSSRMFVPFHGDGVISQFERYDALVELNWDAYRAKYGNIQRLDRILRAEGDDPNRYKIAKQADTVMLFLLFSGMS